MGIILDPISGRLVPVADGAVGPQGLVGPQGPAGADGAVGPQGPAGADGAVGPQGPTGADGAVGPQGPAGVDGAVGPQGPAGSMGPQGPVGAAGPGVSVGGDVGQVLAKASGNDLDTHWVNLSGGGKMVRQLKTAACTITGGDAGGLVECNGSFTVSFADAATMADAVVTLRNAGTGVITLDPNSAQLIDGLSSYPMYPSEARLVQCDGAELHTVVINPFKLDVSASTAITRPPGYTAIEGMIWGGGAAGGHGSPGYHAIGGAGGGCCAFDLCDILTSDGDSATVTIGAGGVGVTALNTNGPAGGSSYIGSADTARAYGGGGPSYYFNSTYTFLLGGAPYNSALFKFDLDVVDGIRSHAGAFPCSNDNWTVGGASSYGGGAGGGSSGVDGGVSLMGGSGGNGSDTGSGGDGSPKGGGGGAAGRVSTIYRSGNGGNGWLTLWGKS